MRCIKLTHKGQYRNAIKTVKVANTRQGAKALRHTWEERLTVSGELMPALTPYFYCPESVL